MTARSRISLHELPDSSLFHMDFLESTWFKTHGQAHELPSPERVRSTRESQRSDIVVRFEELGLIVKSGGHIHVTEAINLWALRKSCGSIIPEVYAWRVLELKNRPHEVFIYSCCQGLLSRRDGLRFLLQRNRTSAMNYVLQSHLFVLCRSRELSKTLVSPQT
jgi:hypothetical protein